MSRVSWCSVDADLEAAIDNLDLMIRWLVLRMVEANTASLLKSLELLGKLLGALQGVGYRLSDTEASLLLPTLIDKSGHNIVQVRGPAAKRFGSFSETYTNANSHAGPREPCLAA